MKLDPKLVLHKHTDTRSKGRKKIITIVSFRDSFHLFSEFDHFVSGFFVWLVCLWLLMDFLHVQILLNRYIECMKYCTKFLQTKREIKKTYDRRVSISFEGLVQNLLHFVWFWTYFFGTILRVLFRYQESMLSKHVHKILMMVVMFSLRPQREGLPISVEKMPSIDHLPPSKRRKKEEGGKNHDTFEWHCNEKNVFYRFNQFWSLTFFVRTVQCLLYFFHGLLSL